MRFYPLEYLSHSRSFPPDMEIETGMSSTYALRKLVLCLSSAQEVRGYVTTVVVAHICGLAQYINSDYRALLVVRQSPATEGGETLAPRM